MEYISTTELRTKSSYIIKTLKKGNSIRLIYRSQIVGNITPQQNSKYKKPAKRFDPIAFNKLLDKLGPIPKLSYKERERRYRNQLEKKYGNRISGH